MSADEVNALIGNFAEVASVALVDIDLTLCWFVIKVNLFSTAFESDIVYINADNITVEQLCFNKCCPAACELIEN